MPVSPDTCVKELRSNKRAPVDHCSFMNDSAALAVNCRTTAEPIRTQSDWQPATVCVFGARCACALERQLLEWNAKRLATGNSLRLWRALCLRTGAAASGVDLIPVWETFCGGAASSPLRRHTLSNGGALRDLLRFQALAASLTLERQQLDGVSLRPSRQRFSSSRLRLRALKELKAEEGATIA